MPYDPRMLQMAQQGVRMMSPDQRNAFADPRSQQQHPKQWWEQTVQYGQPANRPANSPDYQDPNDPERKNPHPSLLQMLMLGGPASYSGTRAAAGSPQDKAWNDMQGLFKSAGPWGVLGGMGGGPQR